MENKPSGSNKKYNQLNKEKRKLYMREYRMKQKEIKNIM